MIPVAFFIFNRTIEKAAWRPCRQRGGGRTAHGPQATTLSSIGVKDFHGKLFNSFIPY
jgi:hypothetical protein